MNRNALVVLLVIGALIVGSLLDHDPLPWHPNDAEVVELLALDDGTALITQRGDAGTFLSRRKPDGTRLWITRVPGEVFTHDIASNDGRIAVRYTDTNTCGIATYTIDGRPIWRHVLSTRSRDDLCYMPFLANAVFANDIVAVWTADGIVGLSSTDGSLRWTAPRSDYAVAWARNDGTIAVDNADGTFVLETSTGRMSKRAGCQLGPERIVLHAGPQHDEILGDRGFASSLPFGSGASHDSELIGCATYRNQIALLVARYDATPETRLLLVDRAGYVTADHHLPVLENRRVMMAAPVSHRSFAGDLPRVIPLIQNAGFHGMPILVDVETGAIVARGAPNVDYEAARDGEVSFFLYEFGRSLFELRPGDQVLRPRATLEGEHFEASQLGGGYIWTFVGHEGQLSNPAITATPVLPRRA